MITTNRLKQLLVIGTVLPLPVTALASASDAAANARHRPAGHTARPHRTRHHKSSGIPQHNGGDRDGDNNGGPSDGDGNI
ncbi:MAG: hypothetical protein ACYDA6_05025 [Solirubrobacteraceae bacterium]